MREYIPFVGHEEVGAYCAGADCVGADALLMEGVGEGAHEVDNAGFGSCIDRGVLARVLWYISAVTAIPKVE